MELEALRAIIKKLENQKQERLPTGPIISEKEVEERRRAEEKAAQEILRLTEVTPLKAKRKTLPACCLEWSGFSKLLSSSRYSRSCTRCKKKRTMFTLRKWMPPLACWSKRRPSRVGLWF